MTYRTVDHDVADWQYHSVLENLDLREIGHVIFTIQKSQGYDLGERGHVFVAGTKNCVGYVGEDRVELVDPRNSTLGHHHANLIEMVSSSLI